MGRGEAGEKKEMEEERVIESNKGERKRVKKRGKS